MAEKNNKNKRKFAAVLLGIVGVAGLSVASASTLTVNPESEVAVGTSATAFASCDADGQVGVGYNYGKNASGQYVITDVYVTDVSPACAGKKVVVELEDAAATPAVIGTASQSNVTVTGGKVSVGSLSSTVLVSTDLGKATVVIG
ncbi:hypothetical protein [Demequina sp. NBRC 110057]|uniref:hypothetical protein n=1 Tax=Demequina sp. NBRC 110057 TaxID=1570346 RepID=UPI0009FD1C55|nr:hypothetical protein [Demequina sp. NBRC 110057]